MRLKLGLVAALFAALVGTAAVLPEPPPPVRPPAELADVTRRGVLRVAVPPAAGGDAVTAAGGIREVLAGFARELGVDPEFVVAPDVNAARRLLRRGQADLQAGFAPPAVEAATGATAGTAPAPPDRAGGGMRVQEQRDEEVRVRAFPRSTALQTAVDRYLNARSLAGWEQQPQFGDLAQMKQRGTLRVLTRNNAYAFFLHRGKPAGFEYELMRRFGLRHNLRIEVVVPPRYEDLVPWLNQGWGDVIAAAMTPTPARADRVAFTRRYDEVDQVLVRRRDDRRVTSPTDLAGRTVHVRAGSAYVDTLQWLRPRLGPFDIAYVPATMETEQILGAIATGRYDYTVADGHILDIEQVYGRPLSAAFALSTVTHAWAVRPGSDDLRRALDDYIGDVYKSTVYNLLKRRYFRSQRFISSAQGEGRPDRSGRISDYDELVQAAARRHELEPALLLAQMYQESRFNPEARSWAGAIGLMQMLPRTAREVGLPDLGDPADQIEAGARYMRKMIDRINPALPERDRVAFALAAYNTGFGHLTDARRLAARQGLDPNRWSGHVEKALPLLQQERYFRNSRHGYTRGSAVVHYVNHILERYQLYTRALAPLAAGGDQPSADEPPAAATVPSAAASDGR